MVGLCGWRNEALGSHQVESADFQQRPTLQVNLRSRNFNVVWWDGERRKDSFPHMQRELLFERNWGWCGLIDIDPGDVRPLGSVGLDSPRRDG